jgi:cytochrome P450
MLRDHLYILNNPEFVVEFFLNHSRGNMKGRALQGAKAVLGTGLLTSDGDFHLRQRRLAQPAFHRDRIVSYAQTMAAITQRHEEHWVDGATFDMVEDMSALTLAIVGETLFGADLTKDAADMNHALTEVLTGSGARLMMGGGLLRLPTPARRRSVESSATLDVIVQRMIDDHRRTGSAALDMAYVAAGRLDGYYEIGVHPWDVAAGDLLVRCAGGIATDLRGGQPPLTERRSVLCAASSDLHAALADLCAPLAAWTTRPPFAIPGAC